MSGAQGGSMPPTRRWRGQNARTEVDGGQPDVRYADNLRARRTLRPFDDTTMSLLRDRLVHRPVRQLSAGVIGVRAAEPQHLPGT